MCHKQTVPPCGMTLASVRKEREQKLTFPSRLQPHEHKEGIQAPTSPSSISPNSPSAEYPPQILHKLPQSLSGGALN